MSVFPNQRETGVRLSSLTISNYGKVPELIGLRKAPGKQATWPINTCKGYYSSYSMDFERYKELFVARTDVFAEQHASGAYTPVKRPLTDQDIAEHLDGQWSIGTYVVMPTGADWSTNIVRYIVFDLDTNEVRAKEWLTHSVESFVDKIQMPVIGNSEFRRPWLLLERSGNKGYHVWVFFNEPVSARQVRLWVEAEFLPSWRGGADADWPLEVFPKQDSLRAQGYGNLIKLPLGRHAVSGKWSEIVGCEGWAETIDSVVPLDSGLVPEVSPSTDARRWQRQGGGGTDVPLTPFPCIDQIRSEGAGEGFRDNAIFQLALYWYGHGASLEYAMGECLAANAKFQPPLSDSYVHAKVESAYTGRYESATCGSDWLAKFCKASNCRRGLHAGQRDAAPNALLSVQPGGTVDCTVLGVDVYETGRTVTLTHPDADNTPSFRVRRNK